MKIGILGTGSNPVPPKNYGGTQSVNFVTATELKNRGHEVFLFAPKGSKFDGNLIIIDSGWGEGIEKNNVEKYVAPLISTLDVIIDTTAFGYSSHKWKDLPYLARMGGDTNKRYCGFCQRNWVWPSHSHYKFHNQGDCPCSKKRQSLNIEGKIVYKPFCYHNEFTSSDDIPFSCNKEDFYLYLGLIAEHKGPHLAVEFANKANVKLKIVGPIQDQSYFNSKIKPYLNNKITYHRAIGGIDKYILFSRAKAVVFTTNCEEGLPNVVLESLSTGTPIIAFNKSTVTEMIEDNVHGILCQDINEMVERHGIMNIDSNVCRNMVLTKFSVDQYITQYLALMQNAIDGEIWI